jgi:hypothetical protein
MTLTLTLTVISITLGMVNVFTIKYMQRTLDAHSKHLAVCDRRDDNNHEAIMDLYNRCNRIEK